MNDKVQLQVLVVNYLEGYLLLVIEQEVVAE